MALPPGYDVTLLIGSLFEFAVPFVTIAFLLCCGGLCRRLIRGRW